MFYEKMSDIDLHLVKFTVDFSIDDKKTEKFSRIETDLERFKFISELNSIKGHKFNLDNELCKNKKTAMELKIQGNSAFRDNNWTAALKIYNEALIITPTENVEDFAILLANRSAVLFHMKQYKLAIRDIGMATKNYPKDKMYKIKERLAKCYLSIGDFHNSLNGFKEMIHCLDEASLPNDTRIKSEKEAQILLKNIQAKLEETDKTSSKLSIKKKVDDTTTKLNDSVEFGYNASDGYYAKAKNDIKIGDSIVIEKPHCAILSKEYSKIYCQHCFLRTMAPIVCPNCPNVIFCSNECKESAWTTYHGIECKILPLIWSFGLGDASHMALRIISQKPLQYFIDIKDELNDNLKFGDVLRLPADDYRTVFTLVRHEKTRDKEFTVLSSYTANFLAACLRHGNYFSSIITNDNEFAELYSFIGGLILRHLQFVQFNTHGIFECGLFYTEGETSNIGSAIYPTLARFNHSCNPSIVRYYKGTTVYTNALTNLKRGEIIPDNYGPIYFTHSYNERQHKLKHSYNFKCICKPCTEMWPLNYVMDFTKLEFKCAGGDINCKNTLFVSPYCKDITVKCNRCNQFTNVFKGITELKKVDALNASAKKFAQYGEYQKAAKNYIEILVIMEKFFKIPFRNYIIVQESYRNCLFEYPKHFKK